jgi:hypothetical protein
MLKREHLIYFSSDIARQINHTSYSLPLPDEVKLDGNWKCAVLDFFISSKTLVNYCLKNIFILADFCETSIVSKIAAEPILKKIYLTEGTELYDFPNPLYIPLKRDSLSDFTITFLDSKLRKVYIQELGITVECTLHLIKHD